MKNILSIILVSCLYASVAFAQPGPKIYPSVYYTYGDYSNAITSNSISGYVPFTWNGFDYITVGYDNLNIDSTYWKYHQQFFLAAGSFNFYPFYLKLGYLHIKGDFEYKPYPGFDYSDFLNLYSAEVLYNVDFLYLGISFDYSNLIGYQALVIKHYGASLLWVINPKFSFELKPLYTSITDGRKLYAASLGLNYSPSKSLTLKLYGFGGERAYYYDEDLLTMFNQNETQKNLASFRVEYDIVNELTLIGNYQYTEFQNYIIRYYVGGLKLNLDL
jgi:hypothetical protein